MTEHYGNRERTRYLAEPWLLLFGLAMLHKLTCTSVSLSETRVSHIVVFYRVLHVLNEGRGKLGYLSDGREGEVRTGERESTGTSRYKLGQQSKSILSFFLPHLRL